MKKVFVRCADNTERVLVLVRQDGNTAFVCPVDKGDTESEEVCLEFAVGFPLEDVREYDEAQNKKMA